MDLLSRLNRERPELAGNEWEIRAMSGITAAA